jgi:hypothetical protein
MTTLACKGRLRNIKIQRPNVRILSIEYVTRVLVEWQLEPTTQNLKDLSFVIERGESPTELLPISQSISSSDLLFFIDYSASLYDFEKTYSYKVVAEEKDAQGNVLQRFESDVVGTDGELDLTAMYVVEELLFQHKNLTGSPCLIYKKRHEGLSCPECFDPIMQRVTKSNCRTCFGTGKMDGYYPPFSAYVTFGPNTTSSNIRVEGVIQQNSSQAEYVDYPDLRLGDLIFDVKDHFFWDVVSLVKPEKAHVHIMQQMQLSARNRSDIEYKIPIPQEECQRLMKEYRDIHADVEF